MAPVLTWCLLTEAARPRNHVGLDKWAVWRRQTWHQEISQIEPPSTEQSGVLAARTASTAGARVRLFCDLLRASPKRFPLAAENEPRRPELEAIAFALGRLDGPAGAETLATLMHNPPLWVVKTTHAGWYCEAGRCTSFAHSKREDGLLVCKKHMTPKLRRMGRCEALVIRTAIQCRLHGPLRPSGHFLCVWHASRQTDFIKPAGGAGKAPPAITGRLIALARKDRVAGVIVYLGQAPVIAPDPRQP